MVGETPHRDCSFGRLPWAPAVFVLLRLGVLALRSVPPRPNGREGKGNDVAVKGAAEADGG